MHDFIDKLRGIVTTPLDPSEVDAQMLAGVSVALRPTHADDVDYQALFIRRSTRKDDPWSGQMAFPGGRFDDTDASLKHTAMRETLEEIGLDLAASGTYLGALAPLEPMRSSRPHRIVIEPHCFILEGDPQLTLDTREVAEAMWLPLGPMISGETHTAAEYFFDGKSRKFPGFVTGGDQPIWGLTYRILERLFELIDPDFRPLNLSDADLVARD